MNLFFKLNTGIFFAALKLQFPDSEGKQTDLFVSNSTHAKKAKFFALRIILMKCVTWLMGNVQTKFVEDMLRYVPVLLLFYCEE